MLATLRRAAHVGILVAICAPPVYGMQAHRNELSVASSTIVSNAVTGAAVNVASALLHHKDVKRAALGGLVGGATIGAAKYAVSRDYRFMPLARIGTSIGVSVGENAAANLPWLSRVEFDAGPLIITMQRDSNGKHTTTQWRPEVLYATADLLASGAQLDVAASLLALSPVTITQLPGTNTVGTTNTGNVMYDKAKLTRIASPTHVTCAITRTLGHEFIHVLQRTSRRRIGEFVPYREQGIYTFFRNHRITLDYALGEVAADVFSQALPYRQRFQEREAYRLAAPGRCH